MEKREEKIKIEFVIDTNILISALIPKNSKLRDILLSGDFRIYAPEYLLKELDKYWSLILKKAEKKVLEIPVLTNDNGIIENAGTYRVITIEELARH